MADHLAKVAAILIAASSQTPAKTEAEKPAPGLSGLETTVQRIITARQQQVKT